MKQLLCVTLSMVLMLSFVSVEPLAAKSKKVQYGDTIIVSTEKRAEGAISQAYPDMAKWHKDADDTFDVVQDAWQFDYSEFDEEVCEEDLKNLRKCLGKKVGQKFTVVAQGGDGVYYTKYKIKKISRPKVTQKGIAKAYKEFIENEMWMDDYVGTMISDQLEFAIIDINHDGHKELYLTGDGGYHANVYAYLGGRVTLIDSQFSGDYAYYQKINLRYRSCAHTGYYEDSYAKFKNGYMTEVAKAEGADSFDSKGNFKIKYKYYVKGKKTTKGKFKAYVKKLKNGNKKAKIKTHKNTSANRKKYIK